MARRYHELRCDVRFWHLADIVADAEHVCFRGQSGHQLMHARMSANDPKRTSTLSSATGCDLTSPKAQGVALGASFMARLTQQNLAERTPWSCHAFSTFGSPLSP